MKKFLIVCFALATTLPLLQNLTLERTSAQDFEVVVDYTYDTNNFFDTQLKRDAMQAAADRYSAIITSSLTAVGPTGTMSGTSEDWRVGFLHPGLGTPFQLSTAANAATDNLALAGAGEADGYGFTGLNANEWRLFAGGSALSVAGQGGTGTGVNFLSTLEDPVGPHHRGLNPVTTGDAFGDLPTWGGAITFDNDGSTNWHFDLDSAPTGSEADFYTIALHEVGHALGLNAAWNEWESNQSGANFSGLESVTAYNDDNGTSLTSLNTDSASNFHWEDGTYESVIFDTANPNYIGTVGAGNLQDLLMEPTANFTAAVRRLELTNTDVAALRDIGWSTVSVPEPSSLLLLTLASCVAGIRRRRQV